MYIYITYTYTMHVYVYVSITYRVRLRTYPLVDECIQRLAPGRHVPLPLLELLALGGVGRHLRGAHLPCALKHHVQVDSARLVAERQQLAVRDQVAGRRERLWIDCTQRCVAVCGCGRAVGC